MTVNRIAIAGDDLVIEPVGLSKLWSFRRRLVVPLAHVRGATYDPGLRPEPKGLRAPGLRLPGRLAGTFHSDGYRQFWNVSGYEDVVVIALDHTQPYDRVAVTVDDPTAVAERINTALPS